MSTLRTFIVFAILAAVGYGVYTTLTRKPPVDPPEVVQEDWSNGPSIQLPGNPTTEAPALLGGTAGGPADGGIPPLPTSAPAATGATMDEAPAFGAGPPSQIEPAPVPVSGAPNTLPATEAIAGAPDASASALPPAAAQPLAASPYTVNPQQAAPPAMIPTEPQTNPYAQPGAEGATTMPSPPAPAEGVAPITAEVPSPNAGQDEVAVAMTQIEQQLNEGRLADAHLALSHWFGDPRLREDEQQQVTELLDQLAGTVIYSRDSHLEPAYEVQPGDTLERIGVLYSVPPELLAKINGIQDPKSIVVGERLKVVRGPFNAVVDTQRYTLTLWLGERYAGTFHVGLGSEHPAQPGTYEVMEKIVNPVYYGPDRTIDKDDPSNPLGERWISLGNQIGIHGTNEPQSIGRTDARGSIRMAERDVDDTYDILSSGSKVTIR